MTKILNFKFSKTIAICFKGQTARFTTLINKNHGFLGYIFIILPPSQLCSDQSESSKYRTHGLLSIKKVGPEDSLEPKSPDAC